MAGVIIKDSNILGGEPVFRGTHVPCKILIDYLEGVDTLRQFLEQHPSVSREIVTAANGELLHLAESFDAWVTLDTSVSYQQNLRGRKIVILILRSASNRLDHPSLCFGA